MSLFEATYLKEVKQDVKGATIADVEEYCRRYATGLGLKLLKIEEQPPPGTLPARPVV